MEVGKASQAFDPVVVSLAVRVLREKGSLSASDIRNCVVGSMALEKHPGLWEHFGKSAEEFMDYISDIGVQSRKRKRELARPVCTSKSCPGKCFLYQ